MFIFQRVQTICLIQDATLLKLAVDADLASADRIFKIQNGRHKTKDAAI